MKKYFKEMFSSLRPVAPEWTPGAGWMYSCDVSNMLCLSAWEAYCLTAWDSSTASPWAPVERRDIPPNHYNDTDFPPLASDSGKNNRGK